MERIQVLFLAANPRTTTQLRLSEEAREIQDRIARSHGHLDFHTEWAVRVDDLQYLLLKHRPHIVHFSGHGVLVEDRPEGSVENFAPDGSSSGSAELVFEDSSGDAAPVSADALAKLFAVHRSKIRCVVLNACHSQQQAESIARSIDFVIGMARPVQDRTAIAFAAAFYQGLAFSSSVKDSFEMGCLQAHLARQTDHDVPKLLVRNGANAGASLLAATLVPPSRAQVTLTIPAMKRTLREMLLVPPRSSP